VCARARSAQRASRGRSGANPHARVLPARCIARRAYAAHRVPVGSCCARRARIRAPSAARLCAPPQRLACPLGALPRAPARRWLRSLQPVAHARPRLASQLSHTAGGRPPGLGSGPPPLRLGVAAVPHLWRRAAAGLASVRVGGHIGGLIRVVVHGRGSARVVLLRHCLRRSSRAAWGERQCRARETARCSEHRALVCN